MLKKWIEDIRVKTKNMDGRQKAEYILAYYWYHILIAVLLLAIICLLIYHLAWGRQKTVFSLAIVNQEIDYARDEKLLGQYAESSGISRKLLSFDSDYILSYDDVKFEGTQESSFEKFFLSWSVGAIDAAVMPVSFYLYCKEKDGEFVGIEEILPDAVVSRRDCLYQDNGKYMGVYVGETGIAENFRLDDKDSVILVFLRNSNKSLEECRRFLEFVLAGQTGGLG